MLTRARGPSAPFPAIKPTGGGRLEPDPGPRGSNMRWRRTPTRSGHRARRRCENGPAGPGLIRPASAIPATNSSRSSTPRNDPARLVAVLLRLQQSAHLFRRAMAHAPWNRTDVPVSAAKRSTATAPCRRLERTRRSGRRQLRSFADEDVQALDPSSPRCRTRQRTREVARRSVDSGAEASSRRVGRLPGERRVSFRTRPGTAPRASARRRRDRRSAGRCRRRRWDACAAGRRRTGSCCRRRRR